MISSLKNIKRLSPWFFIGGLILFTHPLPTRADLSTTIINYEIHFSGPVKTIQTVEQRQCKNNSCTDFYNFEPWGSCSTTCSFLFPGFWFDEKSKLVMHFTDGTTAESQLYNPGIGLSTPNEKGRTFSLVATVTGEDIQVTAASRFSKSTFEEFIKSFRDNLKNIAFFTAINLFIEVLAALIFLLLRKYSWKILFGVAVVNLISWPLFYALGFVGDAGDTLLAYLLGGEIFVWLFEAAVIWMLFKKYINFKNSLLLSFVTNLTSILFSIVLPFVSKIFN